MNHIEMPISRGLVTLVDAADLPLVDRRWSAKPHGRTVYAFARIDGHTVYLHRLLLGVTDRKVEVDHINHDGLDNRRSNLRVVTHGQNSTNRRAVSGASSRYKGVSWRPGIRKWHAQIALNGQKYHLGFFPDEAEAALAHDAAARELHGEFAFCNFPEAAR